MSEQARQFRIGLFVLSSLAILAAALFAFGVRRQLERTRRFETYVTGNADGLTVGAAVKLKGVSVGEVTKVSFSWIEYPGGQPPCVVIYFEAKESVNPTPGSTAALDEEVRRGLRAVITNQGITGAAFLSLEFIDPARNPPLSYSWTPRGYVIPNAESRLSHIVDAVERTLTKLERVDVDRISQSLTRTLQSADAALDKLSQIDAARLSHDLGDAASSTRSAAAEFRALAKEARGTLRGMQLEAVSEDADRLLRGLQDSNAKVQRLVDRFAGVDVRDLNETLAGTREAARHLDDTIEELRKYPSGFLFGKEPPPARSVAREKR
jgi:phospholipid/cholesterol/gamma-HCH transport system substrate-binding protein